MHSKAAQANRPDPAYQQQVIGQPVWNEIAFFGHESAKIGNQSRRQPHLFTELGISFFDLERELEPGDGAPAHTCSRFAKT
jgi:hypothetical protein